MGRLKAFIEAAIQPNNAQRINAEVLQATLLEIIKGDKGQDFAAAEVDSEVVKVAKQIVSDNYIGGLLGSGFKFDAQKGELELRKLRVWEELITSVLVKNEVQIMRNEMWFTDGGTVAGLIADGSLTNDQRRVQFKEKPSFRTGDLLKAIVEFTDGGAGFRTAQYRVDTLHADGFTVTLTLVNGIEPVQDMVVARIGNDTDVERQKSVYIDGLTGYIRQLGGMTSFEVTAANVLWHIGNTSGLAALGIDNSKYTDTLYMPSLHVTGDQLIGGRINALDGFNLIDFGKSLVDGLRFRLGDKGSFMQFLDGVFELHNVRLISKDGTVSEGKDGKDGNYSVAIYRWTDGAKPERPQGVGDAGPTGGEVDPSPAGWSLDTDKGVVITNEKGVPIAGGNGAEIADENGAVMLAAYPDNYKLWKSEGTFDGATHELIGAWSDPYQVSATDGEKGDAAMSFELLPSSEVIKKNAQGALTPATVDCRVVLRRGNEREVIGVDAPIEFAGRNYALGSLKVWNARLGVSYSGINGRCKVGDKILTQARVSGSGGTFLLSISKHGKSEEGKWVSGTLDNVLVHYVASIDTQEQADAANAGQILFNYYIGSGSYTTTERVVCFSSDPTAWTPAPEDYAIRKDGAAYTAGTAVTPTSSIDWTLHDPRKASPIHAKTTVLVADGQDGKDVDPATLDAYARQLGYKDSADMVAKAAAGQTIISGGYLKTDLINTKALAANNAFINNLVARSIDTREVGADGLPTGKGVVIGKGLSEIEIMDNVGNRAISISEGEVGEDGKWSVDPKVEVAFKDEYAVLFPGHLSIGNANYKRTVNIDCFGISFPEKYCSFRQDGITLPPSAKMNMPGVLCAGRVNKTGPIATNIDGREDQWGCRPCSCVKHNGQTGRYKIMHDIKHTRYYVTANLASSNGAFTGSLVIVDKQPSYVVLGVKGLDNEFYDMDFEFMICGQS